MKKNQLTALKTTLYSLCLSYTLVFSVQADTITLAADLWCPYNCEPNSAQPGYMVEIVQQIFVPLGHQVRYQTVPWARAIQDTRVGRYTAILGAYRGDAPDFILPEESQGHSDQSFFVKADSTWNYTGQESLAKLSLGVVKDYDYGDFTAYIEQYRQDASRIQMVAGQDTVLLNLQKLLKGRVDVILEDSNAVYHKLKTLKQTEQVRKAGEIIPPLDTFVAFSPVNPRAKEYAKILSEGMHQLRKSGELAKILSKYGLQDWR